MSEKKGCECESRVDESSICVSDDDLDKLQSLCELTTGGRWDVIEKDVRSHSCGMVGEFWSEIDAQFLVLCKEMIPRMVEEIAFARELHELASGQMIRPIPEPWERPGGDTGKSRK